MTLLIALPDQAGAQDAETTLNKAVSAKKPYQIDLAIEFAHEDYGGVDVNSLSKLFTYTNFYSPKIHLKVEGNASYTNSDLSDVYASVLGGGFAYFFNDNWSLTSFLRGGVERDHKADVTTRVLGFDTTNEAYFDVGNDNVVSIENKFGYVQYRSYEDDNDQSYSNGYFYSENYLGYDLLVSKNGLFAANEHARVKLTGGVEHKHGGDDGVKTIYDAIVSLRSVDATTGNDKTKFEIRGSIGDDEYKRVIGGIIPSPCEFDSFWRFTR